MHSLRFLAQVLLQLKEVQDTSGLCSLASQLHRGCAALRASLEQHVRAEEQELWPLFAEHFTTEEQERLVGVIIGRTGAEVLQSLLPWVTGALAVLGAQPPEFYSTLSCIHISPAGSKCAFHSLNPQSSPLCSAGSFTDEEMWSMMESLRSATRNTAFERWLASTMGSDTSSRLSRSDSDQSVDAAACARDCQQHSLAVTGPTAPSGNLNPTDHVRQPAHAGSRPADSGESHMPQAQLTRLVPRRRANSRGSSRMLSDNTASMDAIAPYLASGRVDERTAESQPRPAAAPLLPADAPLPATSQRRLSGNETGPFRPGWKVCLLRQTCCGQCLGTKRFCQLIAGSTAQCIVLRHLHMQHCGFNMIKRRHNRLTIECSVDRTFSRSIRSSWRVLCGVSPETLAWSRSGRTTLCSISWLLGMSWRSRCVWRMRW